MKITKDMISLLHDARFIKLYDMEYEPGRHYYEATRRNADNLVAIKSEEEFCSMLPDAIGCCIIIKEKDAEPKLLLVQEFRYPIGRFILSPTSGIIDPADMETEEPMITAAKREIKEETGLTVKDTDKIYVANPCMFTSPATLDESCALVCASVQVDNLDFLNTNGAEETELFDGFVLLSEAEVREVLKKGRDDKGRYYSIFTWVVMMQFLAEIA